METDVHWRYNLTVDDQARFRVSSRVVEGLDDVSITVIKLLGMVILAGWLVVLCEDPPAHAGDCVMLWGASEAAVEWVRRCRRVRSPAIRGFHTLFGSS